MTEPNLLVQREKRANEAFGVLKRDRLEATYQVRAIRDLETRLENLANGSSLEATGDPDHDTKLRLLLEERLAELKESQGEEGDISAPNPVLPVLLVKPTPDQRKWLDLVEKKVVHEKAQEVQTVDGPLIEASMKESVRTTLMVDGLVESQEEVEQAVRGLLVDHLLNLEGKSEEQASQIDPLDPELEFSDEELERLRVDDSLEGGALADALLSQEARRVALFEEKKEALVKERMRAAAERKRQLMKKKLDTLIGDIVKIEVLNRALLKSKEEALDYWLLTCVRDPQKPEYVTIRDKRIIKNYRPYFKTIEEVKALKETEGLEDFYHWLVEQKSRLDVLQEGDLYILAMHEPFRDVVSTMLRARRGTLTVADLFGQGA